MPYVCHQNTLTEIYGVATLITHKHPSYPLARPLYVAFINGIHTRHTHKEFIWGDMYDTTQAQNASFRKLPAHITREGDKTYLNVLKPKF